MSKGLFSIVSVAVAISWAASSVSADEVSPSEMKPYSEKVLGTDVDIPLIPIPVGTKGYSDVFLMGSPTSEANRGDDEGPQVQVTVEPFWIGKLEITWDDFNAFREEYNALLDARLEKPSTPAATWTDAVSIPTPLWEQDSAPILQGLGQAGGYPVADISQYAAMQFTKWLSKKTGHFYRLPTEAEWEYAARAGTTTAYYFGDDPEKLPEHGWYFDTSAYDDPDKGYPGLGAGYRKVGLKKASPWGLHDICGNVSEWVIDQHAADGYGKLEGKRVGWLEAVVFPTKMFPCVVRGGNWESDPKDCRSAARLPSSKQWQKRDPQIPKSIWWYTDAFHVGFRILRPLREPSAEEKVRFWDSNIERIQDIVSDGEKELRAPIAKQKGSSQ